MVRFLDDLAWDNMYVNYDHAYNYAIAANTLAAENNLPKSTATTYNTLGVICRRRGWYEESKACYRKADKIWDELGIVKQKLNIYQNLANVVRAQGYNDSAIYFSNLGLDLAIELNDSAKISVALLGLGTTYKNMGWDETAIDFYTQGAKVDQDLQDTIGLGIYWSNIGDVMFKLKDYDEALYYHRETLKLDEYDNNKLNQSITWKAIGMNFQRVGLPDSAEFAYNKALALAAEIGDDLLIGEVQVSKAEFHLELGQSDEAIRLFDNALRFAKEYEDPLLESSASLGLGKAYLKRSNLKRAVEHLTRANLLARQIAFGTVKIESYQLLADAYARLNQSSNALENLQQYVLIKDSLNNAATQAKIAELENKYELSNKDYQIALQASIIKETELQSERNNAMAGAVILSLLAILGLIIWLAKRRQYKSRIRYEFEKHQLKEEQIHAVISSQEKERKRFAMDLHDDFGQLISALKLNVSKMKSPAGEDSEKAEEILDNMYDSLKNIAFDLMPHTLFDKGIEEALEELKDQINSSGQIRVAVQSFEIKDKIDDDQKVALYRVVQELVSNIIKYSNASRLNLSITDLGQGLSLLIEDNGDGFSLSDFKNGKGNGWKNIHSRLDLLKGHIEFDTIPGRKNTTVIIEVPYQKRAVAVA